MENRRVLASERGTSFLQRHFSFIEGCNPYFEVPSNDERHQLGLTFVKPEGHLVYIKLS